MRGRLTAGLLNKAERGELALHLPAGLTRDAGGAVVKDPDREVRDRIDLVFTSFLEQGSVGKVMRIFAAPGPRRAAVRPVRRGGVAAGHARSDHPDPEEPGICRGVRLWPDPLPPHAVSQRQTDDRTLSDGGVEDRCEGQIPGLHHLGKLRADPGDAARQPRGIRPEQDARRAPRRRRAAPGHRLVRAVRPQDGRAVPGQQPLHLPLPASLAGRPDLPAASRRSDRRAGGGGVLRGGDAGRVGGLDARP